MRDFEDLRQWLQGQFSSDSLLEELPEELELLPGLTVRIPRPLCGESRWLPEEASMNPAVTRNSGMHLAALCAAADAESVSP